MQQVEATSALIWVSSKKLKSSSTLVSTEIRMKVSSPVLKSTELSRRTVGYRRLGWCGLCLLALCENRKVKSSKRGAKREFL